MLARHDELVEQAMVEVQLDELVEAAVQAAQAHYPGVAFVVRSQPSAVSGDPARLRRAIDNLLDNAGKWSAAGSSVEVDVAAGQMAVRDHGPGVAPADRPHIFDRFWRAPGARSTPGSGLGLAIVAQTAQIHGGTVRLESPIDGGARFASRCVGDRPAGGDERGEDINLTGGACAGAFAAQLPVPHVRNPATANTHRDPRSGGCRCRLKSRVQLLAGAFLCFWLADWAIRSRLPSARERPRRRQEGSVRRGARSPRRGHVSTLGPRELTTHALLPERLQLPAPKRARFRRRPHPPMPRRDLERHAGRKPRNEPSKQLFRRVGDA
jgi:Histidine kinase-, DNA gyrase B-, and HSP90-like ATPase